MGIFAQCLYVDLIWHLPPEMARGHDHQPAFSGIIISQSLYATSINHVRRADKDVVHTLLLKRFHAEAANAIGGLIKHAEPPMCANPQFAAHILHTYNIVVRQKTGHSYPSLECPKTIAVITVKAIESSHPHKSFLVLQHLMYHTVRKTIFSGYLPKAERHNHAPCIQRSQKPKAEKPNSAEQMQ